VSFSTGLPAKLPVSSIQEKIDYAQSQGNSIRLSVRRQYKNEDGTITWGEKMYDNLNGDAEPIHWEWLFRAAVETHLHNNNVLAYLKPDDSSVSSQFKLVIEFTYVYYSSDPLSRVFDSFLEGECTLSLEKSGSGYIVPQSEIDGLNMLSFTYDTLRVKSAAPIYYASWGGILSTNGQQIAGFGSIYSFATDDGGSLMEVPLPLYETPGWTGNVKVVYESGATENFRIPEGTKIIANTVTVGLARTNGALRFSVEGRSTIGYMVIESSSDLGKWESFSTITNYSGLAWAEIPANGPQEFYRARTR
jgi:hypothetical protein